MDARKMTHTKFINVGCGTTPIKGWLNYDNSVAIKIAKSPGLFKILKLLNILSKKQIENINWNMRHEIKFANVVKSIPVTKNSAEVIYSSHMVEHLSRADLQKFLKQSFSKLAEGGVLRVVLPDLQLIIDDYNIEKNSDVFMEKIMMEPPEIDTLISKLKLLIVGYRQHQWMYNAKSISKIFEDYGFSNVCILAAGETTLAELNGLDLYERSEESLYIEGKKPKSGEII